MTAPAAPGAGMGGAFAILALLIAAACRPDPGIEAAWVFVCPICGKGSTNPDDAAHGYCGACRDVTDPRTPRW